MVTIFPCLWGKPVNLEVLISRWRQKMWVCYTVDYYLFCHIHPNASFYTTFEASVEQGISRSLSRFPKICCNAICFSKKITSLVPFTGLTPSLKRIYSSHLTMGRNGVFFKFGTNFLIRNSLDKFWLKESTPLWEIPPNICFYGPNGHSWGKCPLHPSAYSVMVVDTPFLNGRN